MNCKGLDLLQLLTRWISYVKMYFERNNINTAKIFALTNEDELHKSESQQVTGPSEK